MSEKGFKKLGGIYVDQDGTTTIIDADGNKKVHEKVPKWLDDCTDGFFDEEQVEEK